MTGSSSEMIRAGIINKVVPAADLVAECRKMAQRIARNAPTAIRQSKQVLLKAYEVPAEAKRLASELFQQSSSSHDAIGGVSAVANKQKRTWSLQVSRRAYLRRSLGPPRNR